MSSIQERLQLKRVPLDSWNIREQLCLASAVVRSGDQNWMSVSRALKTVGEPNRPPDWYSQKSCAAQYGDLLENVETPKRKKRSSEGAAETPQESIVSRLTQDRIAEIQKTVAQLTKQHEDVKNELNEVLNPNTSDERIKEIWAKIEATERAKERELARRAASLKERDERRAKAMRTSRGPPSAGPVSPTTRARIKYQWEGRDSVKERDERRTKAMKTSRGPPSAGPVSPTTPTSTAAPPSSPLLTSLLKSSPVVTTPQHIPHPATVVDTISPSVTAPTLSMLLEKTSPQQDSKRAAIERIKTQLVQIEQQFKANPGPPAVASSVDIDDIEIKDEDVYVFRDIELHNLPQVNTAPDKPEEKSPKKEEVQPIEVEIEAINPSQQETKEEESNVEEMQVDVVVPVEVETETEVTENVEVKEEVPEAPPPEVESIQISFPEVKFPTPEIKVIENDEPKQIKEEIVEPELPAEEPPVPEEVILEQEEPIVTEVVEEVSITQENPPLPEADPPLPPEVVPPPPEPEVPEVVETRDIPLPPDPVEVPAPEPPLPPEPEVVAPKEEPETEAPAETPEVEVEAAETKPDVEINTEDFKREDDSEDSIPLKQMLRDENQRTREERATEENHTETDDDAPMELSREEEKDGKKKRDYSRKKKSDSRTCSGSESAEASAPESPSTTDHEKEHRLWKKSVMLVYSRLCAHKYASLFLRPITDEEAPGYSTVVKRPMDLTTIRRNIDNGHIRTTAEFQRAVLLMLSNALMYNSSEHSVYSMTKEMHEEAACQLGMLLAAQAHAGLCPPPRRKRASDPRPRHKRL